MRRLLVIGLVLVGAFSLLQVLVLLPVLVVMQSGPAAGVHKPGGGVMCPGSCSPGHASAQGVKVAQAALTIAQHLSGAPDVYYDSGLPGNVLAYWARSCPLGSGCFIDWQEGNLQCVLLVTGAYDLAGDPLPATGYAIDFWSLYANRAGWMRVVNGKGLPAAGDIMVWGDKGFGHVAIVLSVSPPRAQQPGTVIFAQANGPSPVESHAILPDGYVVTWPGYWVLGFLRAT